MHMLAAGKIALVTVFVQTAGRDCAESLYAHLILITRSLSHVPLSPVACAGSGRSSIRST